MKHLTYTAIMAILLILSSCGKDRSGEFYALIEDRMWMEKTMLNHYLWYQDIPVVEDEDDYFQAPTTFFKNMLSKEAMDGRGDSYSYMEEDPTTNEETKAKSMTLDNTSTYGMEFNITKDPTGTTNHTYARILYTLAGSPAEQAGIQRGDWLTSINGERITTSNYQKLIKGGILKVSRSRIVNTDNGAAWQAMDTLNIGASIAMEINPFLTNQVYEIEGQKIAYLVYNEFATGPNNEASESVYNEQMKQIFVQFKAQQPDALILDLRYNNGGYLQCAQALGSLIAPSSAMGQDFIQLTFNDKSDPQIVKYAFDNQYADANLGLDKVYILTSNLTASASEAVIQGLIPYLGKDNIILIGTKTEGKNVAMQAFRNDVYGLTLWPVVAYVANADGDGDYGNGFTPQYRLDENSVITWYPLGDPREYLLKNTLSLITSGTMPDLESSRIQTTNILRTSIAEKGILIH